MGDARVETRCSGGVACEEVVARLRAADLAAHQLDLADAAKRLRDTASKIAQVHLAENR